MLHQSSFHTKTTPSCHSKAFAVTWVSKLPEYGCLQNWGLQDTAGTAVTAVMEHKHIHSPSKQGSWWDCWQEPNTQQTPTGMDALALPRFTCPTVFLCLHSGYSSMLAFATGGVMSKFGLGCSTTRLVTATCGPQMFLYKSTSLELWYQKYLHLLSTTCAMYDTTRIWTVFFLCCTNP